ncbi:hypothetical protein [Fimbriimonas ginsengisoli]|uniref:Uncharacterized protein n=1 Tax=Fimbriimonas ginsengisoli Gsoil 348 TaxID=661478 RepID=A0A068NXP3_FIMGI|nr:hypothetical protein [Fimbriimonas ginsengisoli]AIE88097.1 hypothetical protein OP10G_4729 [Fimbriimonas ginsengisoli Gsoil 348]
MRSIHRLVIAMGTASLIFLGLAGTRAHADNIVPLKSNKQVVKGMDDLAQIRAAVQRRNQEDGGCG